VAELHAADLDSAAVRCARHNLAPLGGHVHAGDLYAPLPTTLRGRVDVLLANVPYVPSDELAFLPAEARLHEPRLALDGGADGLGVLRRVAAQAADWLAPGGSLLTEAGEPQAPLATEILARAGLTPRVAASEEPTATVVIARFNARSSPPQGRAGMPRAAA
jgi:release factor glutamine methyltransferase